MLQQIPIGGLRAHEEPELNAVGDALIANNCYVDTGGIRGRNGYRSVLPSTTLIGSGTQKAQGVWRHRVSDTSARLITVHNGNISAITDPSADDQSDGTLASIASGAFGATANISAAQLGDYLYIASDEAGVPWRRITPSYAGESLVSYNPPGAHTATLATYTWSAYRAMVGASQASVSATGCAWSTTASGLLATWYGIVGTSGDSSNPADGSTAKLTLTTAQNAAGAQWMVFAISPPTSGSSNKHVYISVSEDDVTYTQIGDVYDTPIIGGSPNLIWCSLSGLTDAQKDAIKYIRFEVDSINDGADLRYAIYGHMIVRSRSEINPTVYYVDFYNTTSQWASPLSAKITVSITSADAVLPAYPDQYMHSNSFASTSSQLDPLNFSGNQRIFMAGAVPGKDTIGAGVTINGTTPALTGPTTIRLWKETSNGLRLVTTATYPGASTAYSLTDNGGVSVLAAPRYVSNGSPPRVTALAARAQRLIGGYLNRMYISSFMPTNVYDIGGGKGPQPFPRFPDVATEEGDGWSFDISPGSDEIILSIVNGDSLYICTNRVIYNMSDMSPNSQVYHVHQRGVVGRRAAIWAEQSLYWCAWDGVYACRNRADVTELSEPIRRHWRDVFKPGADVCMGYKDRKLYVFNGDKYLRYDFVTASWTSGDLSDAPSHTVVYSDSGDHLCMFLSNRRVVRWQDDATSDLMFDSTAGTAIPDWTYSTGYEWIGASTGIRRIVVDASDAVTVTAHKTTDGFAARSVHISSNMQDTEIVRPFAADLKSMKWRWQIAGRNDTRLIRILWEPEVDDQRRVT